MAGDWIKMRADLFTHPKVIRISSALKADTLRTVGGLMSVWCLFDAHSVDGSIEGYSLTTLDDHVRWPGFSSAMVAVGWLMETSEGLELPRFEAHNGQSAKRRAQDADRKKEVRKASANDADEKRTREEKRREENKEPNAHPSDDAIEPGGNFEEFWKAYPKRKNKGDAIKAWRKIKRPAETLAAIIAALSWQTKSSGWTKDGGQFIPYPASYLNACGWMDDPAGKPGGSFDLDEFLRNK